ncbi:MAG: TOBE domain-containing protein [Arcobacteraceae bacterium]|nr:TOBE domain-containing protein [Arcobacteraceae bacterium]
MSKITATVTYIDNIDSLNIVTFDFLGTQLKMMSLDLNDNIKIGTKVLLAVKPTHIALAKKFNGVLSYDNQIKANIIEINNGKLLSSIKLLVNDEILESIITKESALNMDLKVEDEVTVLIKASELSIQEVLND